MSAVTVGVDDAVDVKGAELRVCVEGYIQWGAEAAAVGGDLVLAGVSRIVACVPHS